MMGPVRPAGIHHVAINVSDLDAALAFYVDVLGLTLRTDRPELDIRGSWLDAGGEQVHLVERDPPAFEGQHFALLVEDLDGVIDELRGRGVKVTDAVAVGTARQAFLRDPAGNRLELHQRTG
jgi:glyoxylase I family protein